MMKNDKKKRVVRTNSGDTARRNPMHKPHLIMMCIFFCFYAFLILFPYLWILMNSFKGQFYITSEPFRLPNADTFVGLDNYINGIRKIEFFEAFG